MHVVLYSQNINKLVRWQIFSNPDKAVIKDEWTLYVHHSALYDHAYECALCFVLSTSYLSTHSLLHDSVNYSLCASEMFTQRFTPHTHLRPVLKKKVQKCRIVHSHVCLYFIPNNAFVFTCMSNALTGRLHVTPSVGSVHRLQDLRACPCDVLSHGWCVLMRCNLSVNGNHASSLQAIHAALINVPFSTGYFAVYTIPSHVNHVCMSRSVWECWARVCTLQ